MLCVRTIARILFFTARRSLSLVIRPAVTATLRSHKSPHHQPAFFSPRLRFPLVAGRIDPTARERRSTRDPRLRHRSRRAVGYVAMGLQIEDRYVQRAIITRDKRNESRSIEHAPKCNEMRAVFCCFADVLLMRCSLPSARETAPKL